MPLPIFGKKKEEPASAITHIIAVAAGKGGVGKSTAAVNLARAFRLLGFNVGLLDADVYGPSARKMLPEDQMPVQKNDFLEPALCEGIRMISMAYFRKEGDAAAVRAPIANGITTQFINQVKWGRLDYLFIDFPPGTGDIQLTLCQKANLSGAVMVTTPQEIAMMDVRKAINMFNQVQIPIIGIIENMSGYQVKETGEIHYLFGKGGGEKLAKQEGVPFLGCLPIDPELSRRADKGISIFAGRKDSICTSADAFLEIAERVHSHAEALKEIRKDCLDSFELLWKEMP